MQVCFFLFYINVKKMKQKSGTLIRTVLLLHFFLFSVVCSQDKIQKLDDIFSGAILSSISIKLLYEYIMLMRANESMF